MHLATLKSKMFWGGVLQVLAGGTLIYLGSVDAGAILCGTGLTAITGSDRLTKLLERHKEMLELLKTKG
jgi:hypothetical protein